MKRRVLVLAVVLAFAGFTAQPAATAPPIPIDGNNVQVDPMPGGCWVFVSGNGQMCLISAGDAGLYNVVVVNACGRFWCDGRGTWYRVGVS